MTPPALRAAGAPGLKDVLVCVFQRGAADGMNSVVPYGDDDYYNLRPRIAVPPPGQADGALWSYATPRAPRTYGFEFEYQF